jgi:hypothetical protein
MLCVRQGQHFGRNTYFCVCVKIIIVLVSQARRT